MDSQKPPPPLAHATTSGHGGAVEKLQSLLMKCAIASAPTKSVCGEWETLMKKRIQEFVPTNIHTPDHPPYAWMIENAIEQLNEEGGSDEEAISKFILKENKDLPWIHAALLNHHLKRLSETGYLTNTHDGCYFIGTPPITNNDPDSKPDTTTSRSPSPTPSPSSVSSFSPTNASSDTSGSSQSSDLKKWRKCRQSSQRQKQNSRGIRIHHKYKKASGSGRGQGRARGRGRGREVGDDICMEGIGVVEILSLLTEDEATDDEDIVLKEETNQDYVHLESLVKPDIGITCTKTSRSPSPSPSPSPVSSFSPTDASSDTSGSSQSFDSKKRRNYRKTNQRRKPDPRGIRNHPKFKGGRGCARALGRGRGRGRELGGDICMDDMHVVEIVSLLTEDEATDDVKITRKEEANQDYSINESRNEPLQQNTGDNLSTPRTIPPSHGRKLTSEKGSKRIRPQGFHPRQKPQTGRGRGRPRKKDMRMMEGEKQCANRVEQEEDDNMDELIEQVYVELTEATEKLCLTTDGEAAEGNLQTKEPHQVGKNQEVVNVQTEIRDLTEMQNKIGSQSVADDIYDVEPQGHESKFTDELNEQQQQESKLAKVVEKQKHLNKDKGICIGEQNQCRKLRQRPSRKERADRSKSSTGRSALRSLRNQGKGVHVVEAQGPYEELEEDKQVCEGIQTLLTSPFL